MADQLKQKGITHFQKGAYLEALDAFEKARKTYASLQDDANEAEIYNNIGVVYRYMQEWEKAEESFLAGRELFAKVDDRYREAQILGNMGDLYEAQRERERAGGYYIEAIEVLETTDDKAKLIQTLRVMSGLRFRQLRIQEALRFYQRSLQVKIKPNVVDRLLSGVLERFLKNGPAYTLAAGETAEDTSSEPT